MKSIKKFLFIFILLFISFYSVKAYALAELDINAGDYELVCRYADGVQLTIARDEVYIQNSSLSIDSTSSSGIKMYLTSEQKNSARGSDGSITYKHMAITDSGKCPSKLYAYDLPAKYETEDESDDEDEENTVTSLYYSTESNVETELGGTHDEGMWWWKETVNNATRKTELDTYLVSEEVYLTTSKETTVCDYQVPDSNSVLSVYLYSNLTILENGNYITPLGSTWSDCIKPSSENTDKYIYVNNPSGKSVAGGTGTAYNAVRYHTSENKTTCKNNNDGNECIKYKYLGSRNSSPDADGNNKNLCQVLGDETIKQLQRIINIMQIVVPILMIGLTTFDVGKLVISGDLEEELPKKKKVIVARFCLLVFFFFLPLITNLIIDGLMDAGVVGVESIECVLE